jgi:hypothetical protein
LPFGWRQFYVANRGTTGWSTVKHGRVVFSGPPDMLKNDIDVQRRWLEASDGAASIPEQGWQLLPRL